MSPDAADHDVRIRYFTPTVEVPVCGHATIAAHYVRAVEEQLDSVVVRQKIQIGILPVEVVKRGGSYFIVMTQGKIEFRDEVATDDQRALLRALGLSGEDMDERCPVQVVSTGHSKVMVGVRSRAKLDSLAPDMTALKELSAALGCNGYYVFTMDSGIPGVRTHGRMFAPAIGINEDPVTGNASGPLGAYLIRHRLVRYGGSAYRFLAEQGGAMGRSGLVDVQVAIDDGEPVQVKIGGDAVIIFRTEVTL
jgi:PhzF family phenazine biosynthesis protein